MTNSHLTTSDQRWAIYGWTTVTCVPGMLLLKP